MRGRHMMSTELRLVSDTVLNPLPGGTMLEPEENLLDSVWLTLSHLWRRVQVSEKEVAIPPVPWPHPPTPFPAILYSQLLMMPLSLVTSSLGGTWGTPSLPEEALRLERAFGSDSHAKWPWGAPLSPTSLSWLVNQPVSLLPSQTWHREPFSQRTPGKDAAFWKKCPWAQCILLEEAIGVRRSLPDNLQISCLWRHVRMCQSLLQIQTSVALKKGFLPV